jgi:hypothetical protein
VRRDESRFDREELSLINPKSEALTLCTDRVNWGGEIAT